MWQKCGLDFDMIFGTLMGKWPLSLRNVFHRWSCTRMQAWQTPCALWTNGIIVLFQFMLWKWLWNWGSLTQLPSFWRTRTKARLLERCTKDFNHKLSTVSIGVISCFEESKEFRWKIAGSFIYLFSKHPKLFKCNLCF